MVRQAHHERREGHHERRERYHERQAHHEERYHLWLVEAAAFLLLGSIMLYQLLAPPVVGLADNGDFARVMGAVGLSYQTPTGRSLQPPMGGAYVEPTYALDPTPWWRRPGYLTSEIVPVRLSFLPNAFLSPLGSFDLRALGLTHALLFLGSTWVLLWAARRLGPMVHLLVAAMVVIVATDVGYVSYFNSLYSDPAGFIGLYLFVGSALALCLRPRLSPWVLLAFYGSALVLATARPQYSPLGVLAAGFGAWAQWRFHPGRWVAARVILPLLLCAGSVVSFAAQPWNLSMMYRYNNVFHEIIGKSSTPDRDLRELGLEPELVRYAGTKAWDAGVPLEDEAWRDDFLRRVGYGQILGFYARHPDRLVALLERGASQLFVVRMDYLGNYDPSSGKPPGAQSTAFGAWSWAKESLLPRTWWFLIGFTLVSLVAYLGVWRKTSGTRVAGVPVLLGVLLTMAWAQYASSLLGEGENDLARHLFLFNAIFDVTLFGTLASLGWLAAGGQSPWGKAPTSGPDGAPPAP